MVTRAYILIETVVGKTTEVSVALQAVSEMTSVDVVTGPYDIIAIAEAEDLPTLGNLVSDGMHNVPGIVKTVSCLAVGP